MSDSTIFDQLREYECPEGCEFFSGDEPMVSEYDAELMLGGDEHGVLRCVDCGAELDTTLEAAVAMLSMIAERVPSTAPVIAALMSDWENDMNESLTGVQQPPDEHSEWCTICARWHQKRDRPIRCTTVGCSTLTDSYHGTCAQHRHVPRDMP